MEMALIQIYKANSFNNFNAIDRVNFFFDFQRPVIIIEGLFLSIALMIDITYI
jgi:hypothetical protein